MPVSSELRSISPQRKTCANQNREALGLVGIVFAVRHGSSSVSIRPTSAISANAISAAPPVPVTAASVHLLGTDSGGRHHHRGITTVASPP
jgi:hypothetical protein